MEEDDLWLELRNVLELFEFAVLSLLELLVLEVDFEDVPELWLLDLEGEREDCEEDLAELSALAALALDDRREVAILELEEVFAVLDLDVVLELVVLDFEVLRILVLLDARELETLDFAVVLELFMLEDDLVEARELAVLGLRELVALKLVELRLEEVDKREEERNELLRSRDVVDAREDTRDETDDDEGRDVEDELQWFSTTLIQRRALTWMFVHLPGGRARSAGRHSGYLDRRRYLLFRLWTASSFPMTPDYVELFNSLLHRDLLTFCNSCQSLLII